MNRQYMSTAHHKLISDESGETIVETLISVLISALALLMLATAVGSAVNIVTSSKQHMKTYYESESDMVNKTIAISGSDFDITITESGTNVSLIPTSSGQRVEAYRLKDSDIAFYERS